MVPAATVSSILMARSRPHSATTLDAIWRINLSESRSTASIPSRSRTFSNVLNTSSSKWAHPPESRFGRSMAVRGGAVLEWTKELRDACRFRRASLRVIKSIISPPYPRAFIGDLDCVGVMSQRRQLKGVPALQPGVPSRCRTPEGAVDTQEVSDLLHRLHKSRLGPKYGPTHTTHQQ